MPIPAWTGNLHVRTAAFVGAACLGALVSRYAVPFPFRYSMSFLPLALAVLLFFLYRAKLGDVWRAACASKRTGITCAVAALLFSACLVIGSWSICEDPGSLSFLHALAIIANALPLWVLLVLFMGWLDDVAARIRQRVQAPGAFHLRRRGCLIIFVVLALCWLPVFLAAFPGFFTCDMTTGEYAEFNQWLTGDFSDEYPFIHVLLLGSIITLGEELTGSFNGGVAIFVGLQALFMAAIFTYVIQVIARHTASRGWMVSALLYLALDPVVSIFVMCTTRDTPFSAFAVLLAALLFIYFSQERRPVSLLVAIAVCAAAFCFFRPNGIIAFVILIPFFILCTRGKRERIQVTGVCAATLLACWLWFVPVASALGVQPSATARLLVFSLPSQQIACVMDSGAYSVSELHMMLDAQYGIIDEEGSVAAQERAPEVADVARWNLERMSTEDIIKAYLTLGVNHPGEYLEAFVDQTQAAWNPYAYGRIYDAGVYEGSETSLFSFSWDAPAVSQSLAPRVLEWLKAVSRTLTVQNVPLLSLLVSLPAYLWLLVLAVARAVITRDARLVVLCALFTAIALTAFFGPCEQFRYYLFLIFGAPLLLTALATSAKHP